MAISIRMRASRHTAGAQGAHGAAKVNTSIEFESRNDTRGEIGNYVKYVNRGKGVSRVFATGLRVISGGPGSFVFALSSTENVTYS
jgi:hypothetical protein